MADRPKWFLKVSTDTGKNYSLEVKGEISTVTGEMLKPKLADSSGVPVAKQILSYKGREINDKEAFDKLGIKPDEELVLTKKVPETKYYLEMLTDAILSFDTVVSEAGGIEEAAGLADEAKVSLQKELSRKVRAMKKHLKNLQEELGCCTNTEATDVQFNAEAQKVLDREHQYSIITGEVASPHFQASQCSSSPSEVDPLLTYPSKVYLPPIMENFYKRAHGIYTLVESVRRLADSSPIAGKLTRASVDVVILNDDVASSTTANGIQKVVMTSILLDMKLLLVKTIRQFIMLSTSMATSVTDEFDEAEFVTAFANKLPTSRVGTEHTDVVEFLVALDKGVIEKQVALRILTFMAGFVEETAQSPEQAQPQGEVEKPTPVEMPPPAHAPPAMKETTKEQVKETEEGETTDEIDTTQVVDALKEGDIWRARLILFYLHYRPNNLGSVDRILHEYKGSEDKLFCHLFDKYRTADVEKEELHGKLLAIAKKHGISTKPAPQEPGRTAPEENTDGGCSVM